MAVRRCPICGAVIESYLGVPLRQAAREHYFIVHRHSALKEDSAMWRGFYMSLPKEHRR